MAINRYRFYVGPLGALAALPRLLQSNSPELAQSIPAAEHRSLGGVGTVDRLGRTRRAWSLPYDMITEDQELVVQAVLRRSANATLRLYDPRKRNSLPEDVSTGGSTTRSVAAFTDIGAATPVFLAADVPTAYVGLLAGGVNWPSVTNAQQLWGTKEQHPLIAGSSYRFSAWIKGSTTFKFGARPFNAAGVEQANVLDGTTNTATGAWTRFSWVYTPAAGIASAYFGLNATGSGNLQTTAWLVQTDESTLKDWTFGYGCPEVTAVTEVSAGYWRTKYQKVSLVLREL
jgi:hypothetical protein